MIRRHSLNIDWGTENDPHLAILVANLRTSCVVFNMQVTLTLVEQIFDANAISYRLYISLREDALNLIIQ